jgi:hypothetical protein
VLVTAVVLEYSAQRHADASGGQLKSTPGSNNYSVPAHGKISPVSATQYLALTVTNPSQGGSIPDSESVFIPFRGTFEGNAAVSASGMG